MSNLIHVPSIVLINSAPASGKSVLVKYLVCDLFRKGQLNYGMAICPTNHNGDYDWLPNPFVHSTYTNLKVAKLMKLQADAIKRYGKDRAPTAFLILDDCLGMVNFGCKLLVKLFSNYRHYKISIFITAQYLQKYITPHLRSVSTYYFTFKLRNKREYESNLHEYFTEFNSPRELVEWMQTNLSEQYTFAMLKMQESASSKYVVSKAPIISNYKCKF
jgi:hypothetical protein